MNHSLITLIPAPVEIHEDYPLKALNTFSIDVRSRYFVTFSDLQEIKEILQHPNYQNLAKLVMGGGSNMLFTRNFEGIILKNNIKGIKVIQEGPDYVLVKSGAGEIWHQLVEFCLNNNFAGIENLSLIPGCVGAAPIQNIGAYGAELKDVFYTLEAVRIDNGEQVTFNKADCRFGYRDSIFKKELKNKWIITSVTLQLSNQPVFNTSYGAIEDELKNMGVKELSIRTISEAVCRIRRSKLPDPAVIGNAGSFFKNPVVPARLADTLKKSYPDIVAYNSHPGSVKLAAGWLIEQAGWKGKRVGDTGVHPKQALVLVNYGNARGQDIYQLAMDIKKSVKEKFGVDLEPEVNII